MHPVRSTLKHVARAVFYFSVGAIVVGGWMYITLAQSQADLEIWHTVELEEEYRGTGDDRVESFADYLALEDALFDELHSKVYDAPESKELGRWSRYAAGGPQDTSTVDHLWNRSMELTHDQPVGGALLLHGATDSPYSMKAIAELLHARGWYVVAPRYPGHGTAPSGLNSFDWRDLDEVVRFSARHLRERVGDDLPLVAIGYSTGSGLAAYHELARLDGEDRTAFDSVVMLSPAMGVSPMAAFAKSQGRVARWLGIPKLAWTSIQPEYDPYKYNSFTVNAGDQVYELTVAVNRLLDRLDDETGRVHGLPPMFSIMSLVDATVSARAALDFHERLADDADHRVLVFEVDRTQDTADFLRSEDLVLLDAIPGRDARTYELTVVSNLSTESDELAAWNGVPGRDGTTATPLGVSWPAGVYSLAHVALPFRTADPRYGLAPYGDPGTPSLGNLQLRGERGVFVIDGDSRMRLRCNPFFDYMAQRIVDALPTNAR